MSDEDEELQNPKNSPGMASNKRRRTGKRLNNIPVIAVAIGGGIIITLIMMGILDNEQQQKGRDNDTNSRGGSALDLARDFVHRNPGLVDKKVEPTPEPPKPTPPPELIVKPLPLPVEPKPEKPAPPPPPPVEVKPPPAPPAPKEDPYLTEFRKRRIAMATQSVGSQIGMGVGRSQATRRDAVPPSEPVYRESSAVPPNRSRQAAPAGAVDYSGRSDLSATGQFSGDSKRWAPPGEVEAPVSPYLLRTGSVIPATLLSGLNSDLPGQIIGQVSQNVYDTATGHYLLIPQGARLIGEYSSQVQYGQSRVFAAWQRLIFPDGKVLNLGAMPASTGAGFSGLKDQVNNHYFRIFGSALMMSAVLAGVEQTQNNGSSGSSDKKSMSDTMSESLGATFGNLIAEMMRKNLSISPTIQIRPGFRLNVMLVKDLQFAGSYRAFDYMPSVPTTQARADRNQTRLPIKSR